MTEVPIETPKDPTVNALLFVRTGILYNDWLSIYKGYKLITEDSLEKLKTLELGNNNILNFRDILYRYINYIWKPSENYYDSKNPEGLEEQDDIDNIILEKRTLNGTKHLLDEEIINFTNKPNKEELEKNQKLAELTKEAKEKLLSSRKQRYLDHQEYHSNPNKLNIKELPKLKAKPKNYDTSDIVLRGFKYMYAGAQDNDWLSVCTGYNYITNENLRPPKRSDNESLVRPII